MLKLKKLAVASLAVLGMGVPWASQAAVARTKSASSTPHTRERTLPQERQQAALDEVISDEPLVDSNEAVELDEPLADSTEAVELDEPLADSTEAVEPEESDGSALADEVSLADEMGDATATEQLDPVADFAEPPPRAAPPPANAKRLDKANGKTKAYTKATAHQGRKDKVTRTGKSAKRAKTRSGSGSTGLR